MGINTVYTGEKIYQQLFRSVEFAAAVDVCIDVKRLKKRWSELFASQIRSRCVRDLLIPEFGNTEARRADDTWRTT